MCTRKGSVIVIYVLVMNSSVTNVDTLGDILANQTDFKIGGIDVERSSITTSGELANVCPIKVVGVHVIFG